MKNIEYRIIIPQVGVDEIFPDYTNLRIEFENDGVYLRNTLGISFLYKRIANIQLYVDNKFGGDLVLYIKTKDGIEFRAVYDMNTNSKNKLNSNLLTIKHAYSLDIV